MAAAHPIDAQTFLNHLRQSGLVGDEQLARGSAGSTPTRGAAGVWRRALLADGVLTRFQAERLLMGRTAGFLMGQYRILEQIGRGGMGRVYKAEHRTMHRVVALKVLASELLATERAVDLFLREVQAVAQLVHPNIVTAFDANEVDGRYYLVLEYIDGPNLDQLVRKQGPLSVGLACDYIRQAADRLAVRPRPGDGPSRHQAGQHPRAAARPGGRRLSGAGQDQRLRPGPVRTPPGARPTGRRRARS